MISLVLHLYVCTACLCTTNVLTQALYEKKQSIAMYDVEYANLQAQVEKME